MLKWKSVNGEEEGVILPDKSCEEVRKLFVNRPLTDCMSLDQIPTKIK